jgi:hypothetical protein
MYWDGICIVAIDNGDVLMRFHASIYYGGSEF